MDGINPTLAFAALFLGLSGHPRDALEPQQQQQAAIILPADFGCAEVAAAMAVPPAVPAGEMFAFDAAADRESPDSASTWEEPMSFEVEEVSAANESGANETGCDAFAPQP